MKHLSLFYATAPDQEVARSLAQALVKNKIAACVNFWTIQSVYTWKESLEDGQEMVLWIKTTPEKRKELFDFFDKEHPYETHCLIEISTGNVSPKFATWVHQALQGGGHE